MAKLSPEEAKRAQRAKARKIRHARKAAELAEQLQLDAVSDASDSEADPAKLPSLSKAVAAHVRGSAAPQTVKQAREQLTQAFEDMGGIPALVKWGKKFPTEFYRLWARLIPKDAPAPDTALPLEALLEKLAQRADMSIEAAAMEIGQETLDKAGKAVRLEDAIAAFGAQNGESIN